MTTTASSSLDAALANLVVVLADNKYFLGRRLSESAIGAPTLESAVACAAIAQEELGHTRPLYSFLEQLPGAPVPLGSSRAATAHRQAATRRSANHRAAESFRKIDCEAVRRS